VRGAGVVLELFSEPGDAPLGVTSSWSASVK
jgi:hypothetical protein